MIEIRAAALDEIPLVRQLVLDSFEEYRGKLDPPSGVHSETLEETTEVIARGGAILAFASGEPVGTARYELKSDHLYCGRLGVIPAYRGLGIGRDLLAAVEQIAMDLGFTEIRLATREVLERNMRLYQRCGYVVTFRGKHPKGQGIVIEFTKQLS